ncbi:MAG: sensor histidine kinase [Erysipelotrichaceae bacterium]|nr:sensor histidine kinase [Erysipelotrichaceae bacterium]
MILRKYIKDKRLVIAIYILGYFSILMMLFAFKCDHSLIIAISIVLFVLASSILLIEFYRKKEFYDELIQNLESLDQKYLVLETLTKPSFYEGVIQYQSLYEINKSMLENVKEYRTRMNDFKEYVEMWIHEVKVPISSLVLMCHNNKDTLDKKYIGQIKRLDNYIDQVLYYVRSENCEKDFLIKEVKLEKIVGNVALRNKDLLLENKIDLHVQLNAICVLTDAKWLEFILNQMINNSIKYKRDTVDSFIRITATEQKDVVILSIYDNGIGIPSSDLSRVFHKSFTGENGRKKSKSTGMGLYIAKNLCDQLGHGIRIQSEEGLFTEVQIIFSKDDFYSLTKM